MILVDFRCSECLTISEKWVSSPPPVQVACESCTGQARRVFVPIRLGGRVGTPSKQEPFAARTALSTGSGGGCAHNPTIPGMCTLSDSAGRVLAARARRDNRALDAELARQEASAAERTPTAADVISPGHRH